MPLAAGTRLGPYEISEQIGAGGMGEVYKANDSRLGRTVAIKVLPAEFTQSAERRQRLEREARAISSLSHPNICTLYDIGRTPGESGSDGTDFLVMEYLEGESLADRLAKGPMPIDQVLRHGREIADALDKAHRQGIVHRDLKPGNVVLTKTGAKLLDFGLAAVRAPVQAGGSATALPTMTAPLTGEGTILGTFQYMAPEQLEGQEADQRTDIFALGALLYEMATARKAFEGKSQASLISSIMSSQPSPISSFQPMTPPALDRVISTCLAKDPENRWQTAHDVALQLEWIAEGGSQAGLPAPVAARRRGRERTAWIVAGAAAVVAIAFAVGFFARAPREMPQLKFDIEAPRAVASIGSPRISPDGRVIAFDATDSTGRTMIWVRPLSALVAQPLAGTEGCGRPFWSPDSRYIGFFAGGKLKKVEITGAPPQTICEAPNGFDGSWSPAGVILFDGGTNDSLRQVSASGGVASGATAIDRTKGEIGHGWPEFLPDGKHFVFLASGNSAEQTRVKWGQIGSTKSTDLGPGESRLEYAPPGYLVFSREGTLMAQPFDAGGPRITGEPFPVSDQVGFTGSGLAHLSVSDNGVLIYRSGGELLSQLVWFDRAGRRLGTLGQPGDLYNQEISPDGQKVAVRQLPSGAARDIWITELARGVNTRFTFDPGNDNNPIWSPDGRDIVFSSDRGGTYSLYHKLASGAAEDESLFVSRDDKYPTDWTSDGRFIIYQVFSGETRFDLYALPTTGDRTPLPLLKTRFQETHGKVSPDGRWLAYSSNESGRPEVYVRSFPGLEGKWQVSTQGGVEPRWRGDGRELVFVGRDNSIQSVKVGVTGDQFSVSVPERLFDQSLVPTAITGYRYTMTRDGQRFLLNCPVGRDLLAPTTVVVNWTAGLNR